MREMELWRDKIQLRIRDRIQTSVSADLGGCVVMVRLQLAVIDGTVHTRMSRD